MDLLPAVLLLVMIIDPVGNVPLFMAALKDVPPERQRRVILRELLTALGVLLLVLVLGERLMAWLGLSPPALGVAGGIVLFLIGVRMIFPPLHGLFGDEEAGGGEPLVVPLAVPLVAGPSAMATIMVWSGQGRHGVVTLGLVVVVAWAVSAPILLAAPWLARVLGRRVLSASERLIGMLLVAVSVQQVLDGLGRIRLPT